MDLARKAYTDIVDLFARGTPPSEILAFRPSRKAQERVLFLLERNKAGQLSPEESAELDRFGELERLMQLVKVRARKYTEEYIEDAG
ncbi:MAG TPA: hypothetical protein VJX67_03750 [Blastocatellia bacterium]|nr:hypothetical protein [Blastocatellia bacterium]